MKSEQSREIKSNSVETCMYHR